MDSTAAAHRDLGPGADGTCTVQVTGLAIRHVLIRWGTASRYSYSTLFPRMKCK